MSWKEQEQEKEQEQGQNKVKLQKTKKVQNTKTKKESGLVMNVIAYIINRLAEPSTYAGIASVFLASGLQIDNVNSAIAISTMLFGAGAVLIPDNKKNEQK